MDMLILEEPSLLVNEISVDIEGSLYKHTLMVELVGTNNILNSLEYTIPEQSIPPEGVLLTKDGVLYGKLNPVVPKDIPRINIDGSGRESINRFDGTEKIVDFKIMLTYNISIPTIEDVILPEEPESDDSDTEPVEPVITYEIIDGVQYIDVSIKIVRNYDIDNYVFMVGYILSDSSVVNGTIVEHTISHKGVTYNKDNILELLKNHSGPFGL